MTRTTATTLYHLILPTIFLNPVLFLHSLNTILTKLLPTMNGHEGNSAQPHLDIHASESLCWGYTVLIVWAQMAAFLRFDRLREEQEKARVRKGEKQQQHHRKEDSGKRAQKTGASLLAGWLRGQILGGLSKLWNHIEAGMWHGRRAFFVAIPAHHDELHAHTLKAVPASKQAGSPQSNKCAQKRRAATKHSDIGEQAV